MSTLIQILKRCRCRAFGGIVLDQKFNIIYGDDLQKVTKEVEEGRYKSTLIHIDEERGLATTWVHEGVMGYKVLKKQKYDTTVDVDKQFYYILHPEKVDTTYRPRPRSVFPVGNLGMGKSHTYK